MGGWEVELYGLGWLCGVNGESVMVFDRPIRDV